MLCYSYVRSGFLLGCLAAAQVWGVTFQKIVDTSSTLPGAAASFTIPYQNASFCNGRAAFIIDEGSRTVIYRWDQGLFTRLVDSTAANPNGGTLGGFRGAPSIDENGNISFYAFGGNHCVWINGTLKVYANSGGQGQYCMPQMRSGRSAAATAFTLNIADSTTAAMVLDINNKPPDSPANVSSYGNFEKPGYAATYVQYNGASLLFRGNSVPGIYTSSALGIARIADTNTTAPGMQITFTDFGYPNRWVHGALFRAKSGILEGIYAQSSGGNLFRVVDYNTTSPLAPDPIVNFQDVATDGNLVAFTDKLETRIHLWDGTTVRRIVGQNDVVDGRTVQSITMSPQCLDNGKLLFYMYSSQGGGAWYLASDLASFPASVPEWKEL